MKTFAFVFPGQGSQQLGMLRELASKYPTIKDTFNEASYTLGYDLWYVAQEGPEETLNQTQCTQPILLAAGVAVWRVWQKIQAPLPRYLAGHSLGEYTALVCSNALDYIAAIKLVEKRGQYMQDAVPPGKGGMAAIIGLDENTIEEICLASSQSDEMVSPANYNSIGQIVIAGDSNAIDRAIVLAKEKGAKLAKKLFVSVPSHCFLMKPAALRLAEALKRTKFKNPDLPVVNNVDACCYSEIEQIKDALIRQLYSPVRWIETVQFLAAEGIPIIVESGPGKVLSGLNKRIANNLITAAINQPESIEETLNYLGG